jgi:peptidoglycan/LPS O-acetylase OafA/YrhL
MTGAGTNNITYRPEIDGLRAIAVLSVVLYHAGIGPAAGFVGVDVFFVISGYLITALLHKEWSVTGRIDMFAFYARRFRRLFAALVLVVISTVVISAFVLSPFGEIQQVAQSASASFVFASNFFFEMTTGGYFDGSTDTLPLLHLWSLAVEEQFYLVWPILLIVVLRLRPNSLVPVLVVLTLSSLMLAELLVISNPEAAFYQMLARFWELAIGGLIALRPSGQLRDGRTAASLSLTILLVAVVMPTTHFPGIGALPAVTGAALLLYAVHGTTQLGMAGMWLRSRPMVFFGLISYSLYLWHWPLLAIDRATRAGPSPVEIRLLLCVVAVVLAWFSYHFVERPFRRTDPDAPNPRIVAAGLTASFALALAAITLGNHLDREPPPTDLASQTGRDMPKNRLSCHYRGDESLSMFPKPGCNSDPNKPVRVVIWGDSMALAWQPFAWDIGQITGMAATSYSRDACPPVIDYSNGKRMVEAKLCRKFNSLVMNKIRDIDTLILSATWSQAADTEFKTRLQETVKKVSPYVKKIILLGPTPHLRDTAPRCINASSLDACAISRNEFDEKTYESKKLLSSIAANFDTVTYIELTDFFCSPDICPVLKDGYGLYWDSYHVSSTAAHNFAATYLGKL